MLIILPSSLHSPTELKLKDLKAKKLVAEVSSDFYNEALEVAEAKFGKGRGSLPFFIRESLKDKIKEYRIQNTEKIIQGETDP